MRDDSEQYYEDLWASMRILPEYAQTVGSAADRVWDGRENYARVENIVGTPWPVVGVIHNMESGCDWSRGLHNGQRWDRVTTLVPAGRGPFGSWEEAAVDALSHSRWRDRYWTIGKIGYNLEAFNGWGYRNRGVNSPYLWSMSNHGVGVGKYVADGRYDPNAVSKQVGAMCILYRLHSTDRWTLIETDPEDAYAMPVTDPSFNGAVYYEDEAVRVLQRALNLIRPALTPGTGETYNVLSVDGAYGPKTDAAVMAVAKRWGKKFRESANPIAAGSLAHVADRLDKMAAVMMDEASELRSHGKTIQEAIA